MRQLAIDLLPRVWFVWKVVCVIGFSGLTVGAVWLWILDNIEIERDRKARNEYAIAEARRQAEEKRK